MTGIITGAVNSIIEQTDLADPHQIAQQVLASLPPDSARDALAEVLPEVVRARLAARRTAGLPASHAAPGRSWKTTQIAELWQRKLADRVPTETGYKQFGDLTAAELLAAADLRRRMAADLLIVADEYQTVARLLQESGVTHVRELPPEVLLGATSNVA